MSTLICGSIAYDSIMVFQGRFKDHILPDQVHILNVSFLVPEMRREFGGVAGNIAYNLKLLGGSPLPMATVGDDAQAYLDRFDALGIERRHVRIVAPERPGGFCFHFVRNVGAKLNLAIAKNWHPLFIDGSLI